MSNTVTTKASGFDSIKQWLAVAVAAVWLLHPINLSPVLYASQRMMLLSSFFVIYGLVGYLWIRQSALSLRRQLVYVPIFLAGFSYFGYLCKENAVLLPAFAFLLEWLILRFRVQQQFSRPILMIYVIGLVAVLCAIAYQFYNRPNWLIGGYRYRIFSLPERLMTESRALMFYLSQIIAPSSAKLSLWHDGFAISRGLLQPATTLISVLGLLGLVSGAIWSALRFPLIGLGVLWFFVAHSLESTFIPLELVHEHRNYLASFGIQLALVTFLFYIFRSKKPALLILCVGLAGAYFLVLQNRASIWSDPHYHALHEATHQEKSAIANFLVARNFYFMALNGQKEAIAPSMEYALMAKDNDPYSIIPEMFLVYLSEFDEVNYDPAWMKAASEKIHRYPYLAPTKQSFKDFVSCVREEQCNVPVEDADMLVDAAFNTRNSTLLTSAGAYYLHVRNNPSKAEAAFRKAARKNVVQTRLNLINYLIHVEKQEQACNQLNVLRKNIGLGRYKKLSIHIEDIAAVEWQLKDCAEKP